MPRRLIELAALGFALAWVLSPSLLAAWYLHQVQGGLAKPLSVLALCSLGIIALLALAGSWRRMFRWLIVPAALVPVQLYLVQFFGAAPEEGFLLSVLRTTPREAIEMVGSAGWALLALPFGWLAYALALRAVPERRLHPDRRKLLGAAVLFSAIPALCHRPELGMGSWAPPLFEQDVLAQQYPLGLAVAAARAAARQTEPGHRAVRASAPDQPLLVILVIGETLRADHLGINGYPRDTTPSLGRRSKELLSFSDFTAYSNFTMGSIPQIVSTPTGAGAVHLTDAFRAAGFRTAWISNHDAGVYDARADVVRYAETDWSAGRIYDAELLPQLHAFLKQAGARQLAVLHTLGSHFPYEARYNARERFFQPVYDPLRAVTPAQRAGLVNAYDNSVRAADRLWEQVIAMAAASGKPALVVITADHGENLYDDQRHYFMHSNTHPSRAEAFVPFVVWANDAYRSAHGAQWQALAGHRDAPAGHLNVTPTVLDLAGVELPELPHERSLANAGFRAQPRAIMSPAFQRQPISELR